MNMSKEEYHKRVNKMYSELRTDRVDADREEVIRCQRLYLAEDRYIPSCEREIERLNNIINELEKWLEEEQKLYGINQQGFSWGVAGDCLDKLKELKEKE